MSLLGNDYITDVVAVILGQYCSLPVECRDCLANKDAVWVKPHRPSKYFDVLQVNCVLRHMSLTLFKLRCLNNIE